MISEQSSDIVVDTRSEATANGEPVELLMFRNELTVAVSAVALAVYRAPHYFGDPLGNGLINAVDVPPGQELAVRDGRLVAGIRSGCVELMDNKILLILPNEIRLYPNREAGLRNRDLIATLLLSE